MTKKVKREVFKEISSHLDKPEITLITGSRQAGKTTLLGQLKEYFLTSAMQHPNRNILRGKVAHFQAGAEVRCFDLP
ncbi:hypothetical protein A3H38_01150 [candidate division WOR-1 bacterium RIFCSPLOWO2_02_FULL_46_20]|uniref:AAA domain-containing protein n=2 Tax=Saganbacteria TaxID=1703751 RepID=A0A1F4RCT9_UNCSA|nr:MAG: hypothetical protein A3J44_02395 [candidate division WOR-1 bacterium RIFCSPHIGHO2_02_FULL_45_12]OGC05989.1 MAG: hypothetical protein A3H38_01150 [candidate division WOR-1 bacterium RIFCSPLOWO2_02_FULL_46_20]OGC09433.1 MAG: hypothetical protein A3F86_00755 [candidate division WOR-1 bacterium RIFCSPLOWO2_12_FULL_45_9]